MDLGLVIFPTDRSARFDDVAVEAEARGFESLFMPEHTHIPASRVSPYPIGGDLPEEYRRIHDPFVVMAAAAARTTTIKLGTSVALLAQRDPIVTAKAIASLDAVSDGRIVLGVGYGWNREEAADHGVVFASRRERLREHVLAMKELWTNEEATFTGEFVRFERAWQWPKPVQRPHPPVYLGSKPGPRSFAHVVEWCDGWMPIPFLSPAFAATLAELRHASEDAGRDPSTIRITACGGLPDPALLDGWRALGIERTILGLPSADLDDVRRVLDSHAVLLAR